MTTVSPEELTQLRSGTLSYNEYAALLVLESFKGDLEFALTQVERVLGIGSQTFDIAYSYNVLQPVGAYDSLQAVKTYLEELKRLKEEEGHGEN